MKKLFILTISLLFCGFIQAQSTSEKDIADWNMALFERPYPDDWKKALTGKQKVYTSSPIYNKPDMVFGGKIGNTANEVEIVSKYNETSPIIGKVQDKNENFISLTKNIYYNEGFKAFWKGSLLRVIRSSPQFGITLYVFENLK